MDISGGKKRNVDGGGEEGRRGGRIKSGVERWGT